MTLPSNMPAAERQGAPGPPVVVDAGDLQDLVQRILVANRVPPDEAAIVADVLVRADLRGVESHGVARLERYYVARLRMGALAPACPSRVIRETPVSAVMDGGNGLGH